MMYSLSLPCGAIGLLTRFLEVRGSSRPGSKGRKVASPCSTATAEIWKIRFERSAIIQKLYKLLLSWQLPRGITASENQSKARAWVTSPHQNNIEGLWLISHLIYAVGSPHPHPVVCVRIVSSTCASAKVSIPFPLDSTLECIVFSGEKAAQCSLFQRGVPVGKWMQILIADGCIVSSRDAVVTVSTPLLQGWTPEWAVSSAENWERWSPSRNCRMDHHSLWLSCCRASLSSLSVDQSEWWRAFLSPRRFLYPHSALAFAEFSQTLCREA